MGALVVVGALGLAVERTMALWARGPTDFDDAYMYVRYARNLLAGDGWAWNPGEQPVNGVTSPLHLGVVTVLSALAPGADPGRLLSLASICAAFALIVALAVLSARLGSHSWLAGRVGGWGAPMVLALPVLVLVGYTEAFVFHAGSGMDTMLAAVANTAIVLAVVGLIRRPSRAAAAGVALVGYIALLARPDGVLLATLVPGLAIALLCPRPRARLFGAWVAVLVVLVGADVLWRWWQLGTPLPLAFYAKRPFFYRGFAGEFTWNPFRFLHVFLAAAWPFLAAVMVLAGRRHARWLVVLLVPAVATIAALFARNQIMGHLGRFYYPSLPLLVAAAAIVIDDRSVRASRVMVFRAAAAAAVILVAGPILSLAGSAYEARGRTQHLAALGGYQISAPAPLPEMDSWQASIEVGRLAAAAPPGASFAMSEHGLVGALAPRSIIIDVLGLHDRGFARDGFSVAELWRRQPDVFWMPHPDHTQMIRDILDSDEFWDHYDFFPDAFTYGFALRRDGRHFATLHALWQERFAACYPGLRAQEYLARRSLR